MLFSKKQVDTIDFIVVEVTSMRFKHEYVITQDDGEASLTRYKITAKDGKDVRERECSVKVPAEEIISLCNSCGILKWDGFSGKHPKNVSDGVMFAFKACVNGSEQIHAGGSENFPKHYKEFMNELDDRLKKSDQNKQ